jgi:hypothetical protein
MWSKFYYYKKHFGVISGYKKTLKHFFSAAVKIIIFFLIKNKKCKKYLERFSGLMNSYLGKPSFRRPKVNEENIE